MVQKRKRKRKNALADALRKARKESEAEARKFMEQFENQLQFPGLEDKKGT